MRPSLSRRVSRSSSACVGCFVLAVAGVDHVRRGCGCRGIPPRRTSGGASPPCRCASPRGSSRCRPASRPSTPSFPIAATLTVSAERRFSANSNEIRVRVEASKNRLTIVLPRNAGTFLMGRSDTSLNGSAVSRISRDLLGRHAARGRPGLCRALRHAVIILGSSPNRSTSSRPSSSFTSTSTRSPGLVCTTLPDDVGLNRAARARRDRPARPARCAWDGRSRPAHRARPARCGRCTGRRPR